MADSLSEMVKAHIEAEAKDGINFTQASNRRQSINRFCEKHTSEKRSSVSAIFSRQLGKVAKAAGENPADFKQQSRIKKNFDQSMNSTIKHSPADVPSPAVQNPGYRSPLAPPAAGPTLGAPGAPPPMPGPQITPETAGSFASAIYGGLQLFSADLEDLTKEESTDLGILLQPIMSARINSDRAYGIMAAGAILGIVARKAKRARAKKKEREAAKKTTPMSRPTLEPEPTPAEPPRGALDNKGQEFQPSKSIDTPPVNFGLADEAPESEADPHGRI